MPRYSHIMLDLETLSTRGSPAVLQIAAVAFDPLTGERDDENAFNVYVNDSGVGADVEPRTVLWWMQQPLAAQLAAKCETQGVHLASALSAFYDWYRRVDARAQLGVSEDDPGHETGIEGLWTKGCNTDIPWLVASFARLGELVPWHYRTPRDMRTLFSLAPGGQPKPPKDEARAHDALYDCEYQIAQVVEALYQVELAKAALQRHQTGVSEVLDKIVSLGLDAVAPTERSRDYAAEDLDLEAARARDGVGTPPAYDPPPVWSNAEAMCEGEANPSPASEGFMTSHDDECGQYDATDSFGHTSAHEPGFRPGSQF